MIESLESMFGPEYATVKDRSEILSGVASGRRVQFVTYSLSDQMEHQLDFVIAAILKRNGCVHLQSTVYTCLKEVIINATRANAKVAYFEKQGLQMSNPEDYTRGLKEIKSALSEEWIQQYGQLASERDLKVTVDFEHGPHGLRAYVWNDVMLTPEDEKRIRSKFQEGMGYEDLVTFYMKQGDQTEGEGMGLVMNLLLLKGENIDPALLRIGNVHNRTMARLEIPFDDHFESVRGPNPHGYSGDERRGMRLDFRDDA